MNNIIKGALAASILTLGAPLAASSALSDPVVISNVFSSPTDANGVPGVVKVAFENESAVTAKSVEFRFTDAGGTQTRIVDAGTFSPGVMIQHQYQIHRMNNRAEAQVLEVRFADGSVWDNQAAVPAQPRRQAFDQPSSPAYKAYN